MLYRAFSFLIDSEFHLDLPAWRPGTADVSDCPAVYDSAQPVPGSTSLKPVAIRRGRVSGDFVEQGCSLFSRYRQEPGCTRIETEGVGRFRITKGIPGGAREGIFIEVESASGVSSAALAHVVDTFILYFLVRSPRVAPLHGSAVACGGRAFVLTGERGSGKSTTAAALALGFGMARAGDTLTGSAGFSAPATDTAALEVPDTSSNSRACSLLCDDLVPLDLGDGCGPIMVLPGLSAPSLLPDAFQKLAGDPATAPTSASRPDKRRTTVPYSDKTLPLAAIIVLETAASTESPYQVPRLDLLAGYRGTACLAGQLSSLPGLDQPAQQLALAREIQSRTSLHRIVRPRNSDSLEAVCALVVHLAEA